MDLLTYFFRRKPAEFAKGRGWTVEVVGELQFQRSLLKQYRRAGGTEHDVKAVAVLVPDDANSFDSNAIKIEIGGDLVGYLTRERAAEYRRAIGSASGACSAKIVGGYEMEDGSRAHFGVKLNLAWPPRLSTGEPR